MGAKTRTRRRSWRRGCLRLTGLAALAVLLGLGWKAATWPDVAALATRDPPTTAFIERFRAARRAAGESDAVVWRPVSYAAISQHLKRAVLVAEDIDFFDHHGFAVDEIRQAVRGTVEEGKPLRGASTITQQLAKNLWLSAARSPARKLEEAILAWQLERHLEKRRILELYLNVVEFGPGVYGAEAAARRYFGKAAGALGEEEAAELAAALPRPSSWHPASDSGAYRARVDRIRRRMARAQHLWQLI